MFPKADQHRIVLSFRPMAFWWRLAFSLVLRARCISLGLRGFPPEKITNLAIYCAMAGIIGAKLFMFLFDLDDYIRNPGQIFTLETLQAAGVFHGGFLAAFLVAVLYIRKQQLPVLGTMDVFAPGIAVGQAIGRLGCFAAGCCWGKECDSSVGRAFSL